VSAARWNAGVVDEEGLRALATALAPQAREGGVIFLEGDLGAGKTTFARSLLGALGVGERIKSPTYSLIESYRAGELDAHHLDLYRIADPGELEWLGLPDLFGGGALVVVEWPERGGNALPEPDLVMRFDHAGSRREMTVDARTERGDSMLAAMAARL
jgi:tRNA threonylcarbamoyladenosine biosynthesis protein TsaE